MPAVIFFLTSAVLLSQYSLHSVYSGGYRGVVMVSAEAPSENSTRAPNLYTIHVGDKITNCHA